jgi:hypothetical protein
MSTAAADFHCRIYSRYQWAGGFRSLTQFSAHTLSNSKPKVIYLKVLNNIYVVAAGNEARNGHVQSVKQCLL